MPAKLRLRSNIRFTPVRTGANVQYVVEDHQSPRFLRIGQLEHELCALFDGDRSTQSVIEAFQKRCASDAQVTSERCQKVVTWVLGSGMLEVGNPLDIVPEENTGSERQGMPVSAKPSKIFDPSFFRIKCITPEMVYRIATALLWLVSWPALAFAVLVWCLAGVTLAHRSEEFASIGRNLFVPGSQWWWLVAWLVLKVVHETGHAVACAKVGSRPTGAGLGFMFFAPSPYVDVTQLWGVENRWYRILVSSAGMLFEMTFSAIAILIAACTEIPSIQHLCISIASLGTLTTLAFNGNPLMRFDGYYILIDAINRPNLWQDATKTVSNYMKSWLFKDSGRGNCSIPLLMYGIACVCSRALMMLTMAWGVWVAWDGLGLLIVGFFGCLWFVFPFVARSRQKAGGKVAGMPSYRDFVAAISTRKLARCLVALALVIGAGFLPSPVQVYWPAFVDYTQPSEVRADAPGFVSDVLVHDCQGVRAGDEILRLRNPDLELQLSKQEKEMWTSAERCDSLRAQRKLSELQAEESKHESLKVQVDSLRAKVASLSVRASRDGILLVRRSHSLQGSFLTEGQAIGLIADPEQVEVHASVPQAAWKQLSHLDGAPVSLCFEDGTQFVGEIIETLPRTEEAIETPALAGKFGGPLAVVTEKKPDGENLMKTTEPRLSTRIRFKSNSPRLISWTESDMSPVPGALCTVQLLEQRESIWETVIRFATAILNHKLPASAP